MTSSPLSAGAFRVRLVVVLTLVWGAIALVPFIPPFPQDVGYHNFADQRPMLSIPHALNVLSNLPFVFLGLWGLWLVCRAEQTVFAGRWERLAFGLLFAFVAFTGVGSSYYHWQPVNATLYWDRLPLTVVFMAFFAILLGERISGKAGAWLLGPLLAAGMASVTWWHWTEMRNVGDVRWYFLVQFLPMALIPLLLALFPARYHRTQDLLAIFGLYTLAKLLELLDAPVFALGQLVSGHTLKHLLAALAVYWMLRMLQTRSAP